MESFASKLIIGIIVALISSWVTVKLSLSKFRTEKLWERKIEAYTKIFEYFHYLKSFSDKHLYAQRRGKDVPEDIDNDLRKESLVAHKEINKYSDIGAFIFSREFSDRLNKFQKDSEVISEESKGWGEYLIKDQDVTETCLNELIELAKKDLANRNKSI